MESITVRLDWKAYLKEFEALHGEPVVYKGKLLYRDGWTYSMSDVAGPEWPPPVIKEKLLELRRVYWSIRKNQAKSRLMDTEYQLRGLQELQETKSARLQVIARRWDNSMDRVVAGITPWNPEQLKDRVHVLESVVKECEVNLGYIAEEEKASGSKNT